MHILIAHPETSGFTAIGESGPPSLVVLPHCLLLTAASLRREASVTSTSEPCGLRHRHIPSAFLFIESLAQKKSELETRTDELRPGGE